MNLTVIINFNNHSNSSTSNEILGGVGYFLLYLSEYFPYTFLSTFATIFGIMGIISFYLNILSKKKEEILFR